MQYYFLQNFHFLSNSNVRNLKNNTIRKEKELEREIFDNHTEEIRYIFNLIDKYKKELNNTVVLLEDRVVVFQRLCEKIISYKKILRKFEYFNKSFINLLMRLSKEEIWGLQTSFDYMTLYFSSN